MTTTKPKRSSLRTCLNKRRTTSSSYFCCCFQWAFRLLGLREDGYIPRDVPNGHFPIYVGENSRRFVINIRLLDHPLFKDLLNVARDKYGFSSGSILRIPCDEEMFVQVLSTVQGRRRTGGSSPASEKDADCCCCGIPSTV
ncbi:hypothetical protein SAY86_024838 [Trapa natans]|uniref:Uncharacterized protein n=1 Tax=Trapa natans TaxID=22666 RepID=A0AAN7RK48_TRANT|nr:hypothetical protein SAY86_024838 [Trapa natans]